MTQGIVSVLRNGQVILKVIVGANGMKGGKLARAIVNGLSLDPKAVDEKAKRLQFGTTDSRVVMTPEVALYQGEPDDGRLHPRYRETFHDPRFNPRWESGLVSCLWIVETGPPARIVEEENEDG